MRAGLLQNSLLCAVWLMTVTVVDAKPRSLLFETRQNLPTHHMRGDLTNDQIDEFTIGKSFFDKPWVLAPSATTARDGLGPLFNANACLACHATERLSAPLQTNEGINRAMIFKLSQPGKHSSRSPEEPTVFDPVYGAQIAINGGNGVAYEAKTSIKWVYSTEPLAEGVNIPLRKPIAQLSQLQYGPLSKGTVVSLRFAPLLVGEGLLEEIPEEDILKKADPSDRDRDGISGRANWVYDPYYKERQLGRIGYKASQSSLLMQSATAAAFDMGLTNVYFPTERCTEAQITCHQAPRPRNSPQGRLDLPTSRLFAIARYLAYQKAPNNIPLEGRGYALFEQLSCAKCHQPEQKTKNGLVFQPFSDLLLHDMGTGLADGRYEFDATPKEWRTAPLWGLGAKTRASIPLLHDGRARNIIEAILWHGGEAQKAKQAFQHLPAADRQALLLFLETL